MKSAIAALGRAVAAFVCVLALPAGVRAGVPNEIVDYSISTWSMREGLPSSVVWSIAQDRDGYLWLGTDAGLVRFDGVRFVAWDAIGRAPLPKQLAKHVIVARDGALWVGYGERDGGVTRIGDGQVRTYEPTDGLGRGAVTALFEDEAGTMWTSNASGLYRMSGGRWERVALGESVGDAPIQTAFFDRAGDLFVATPSAVFRRTVGQDTFMRVETADGFRGRMVRQGPSGTMWVTDPLTGVRRLGESAPAHAERGLGMALLQDRAEDLWIGTLGQGLWRIPRFDASPRLVVEKSTTRTGLSNDVVLSLFEDREGNIWAGTNEGLNRLSPHKVTPITNVGSVSALAMTLSGEVWIANERELTRLPSTAARGNQPVSRIAKSGIRALHVDREGTLWVATSHELARMVRGDLQYVHFPGAGEQLNDIRSLASDSSGAVWLADGQRGVYRWSDARLQPVIAPAAAERVIATLLYSDSSGRVWVAYDDGTLAVLSADGTEEHYPPQPVGSDSRYTALFEDSHRTLWLGGFGWLSQLQNGRFRTVTRANGFPAGYVKAISEVGTDLWIAADAGIIRIDRDRFERATTESPQLRFRLYDTSDGLAGTPVFAGNRMAVRTPDGRLWFVTGKGLTTVDARALASSAPRRTVRIEGIVANGHRVATLERVSLPPHTTTIEIAYTAVNLSAPHKTRFRYRLEGFDTDWVDAGVRRSAYYTNLPPRRYRFHVTSDDDDGSSSALAVPLDFDLEPSLFQTTGFYVALAVAAGVLAWGVWRLRLLQLRREFGVVLAERLRLSREIHDTLLQGLFGVSLQLNALSRTVVSMPELAQARVSRLRSLVDEYIRETRQSIKDLRSPLLERVDLSTALRHVSQAVVEGTDVSFELTVTGSPRRLAPHTEAHVLRIGQEAVTNAVRHAGARRVKVQVEYEARRVTLRVDDDGRGFDDGDEQGSEGSHFGLRSMRERAEAVGGSLRLVSSPGHGTHVEAVVPMHAGAVSG